MVDVSKHVYVGLTLTTTYVSAIQDIRWTATVAAALL